MKKLKILIIDTNPIINIGFKSIFKNSVIFEVVAFTYKKNEMYEEQLIMLGLWLNIEPDNKKALAEKKTVYAKLGKDENDINRERWNADKSNIQYGLDYAQGLIDKDEEIKRLDKELAKIEDDLLRIKGKLANKSFTSKAPKKIVDIEKNRLDELEKNYTKIIQQKEKIISI